jgi:hypothetical protein
MAPVLQDPYKMNMSSTHSFAKTDGPTELTTLLIVTAEKVILKLNPPEENVQKRLLR